MNGETIWNDQMTKEYRSRANVSDFELRHSFVIRHSSFVIILEQNL